MSLRTLELSTTGILPICLPTVSGSVSNPFSEVTTYPAVTCRSTVLVDEFRRPWPSTATVVTSVKPTIRAAAVAAVRLGLRIAF